MEIQHFIHECPLTILAPSDGCISHRPRCEFCASMIFEDSAYGCSKCNIFLHKWCAELPQEINHPFHPQHPLALIPQPRNESTYFICDACCLRCSGFKYRCSPCEFNLDPECAKLKPIANHDDELPYNNNNKNSHTSPPAHPHRFIPCVTETNFVRCSGCEQFIDGTIYVCLQCKFLLHETCTELPYEIQHPFHPQHPLLLAKARTDYNFASIEVCKACVTHFSGFAYRCAVCDFNLDTKCVSLMPSVKFKLHQHPLALFTEDEFDCVCCGCDNCSLVFRCVECDFNLHFHCVPTLPLTKKHQCHRHALTLTKSRVKDSPDEDDDSEFYCDVCEEERYLPNPTYYCVDCHFVAHVHCMIPEEDIPALGEEQFVVEFGRKLETNEEGDSKLDELDEEIEALTAKLEAVMQERARYLGNSPISELGIRLRSCVKGLAPLRTNILHPSLNPHPEPAKGTLDGGCRSGVGTMD